MAYSKAMPAILLIVSAVFFSTITSLSVLADHPGGKQVRVLAVHSYSQDYPWTAGQHEGFVQALRQSGDFQLHVKTEYLDSKRKSLDDAYTQDFADFLRIKYGDYAPHAIYVTDDEALNFAERRFPVLFPGVPVFFSGVNDYLQIHQLTRSTVTGVFEKKEIRPNLDLLQALFGKVDRVVVVGDASQTYRAIERELRTELAGRPGVQVSYVADNQIGGILAGLTAHPDIPVVLTTLGSVRNLAGEVLSLHEVIASIARTGRTVVIGMEDVYVVDGVLGGYVTDGSEQGKAAAGLLVRHLAGWMIEDLPPVTQSPNVYLFNDRVLDALGVELPTGIGDRVKVVNGRPHWFEKYRNVVVGFLVLVSAAFVVSLFAYAYIVRKKNQALIVQAESIKESEERFAAFLDHLPAAIFIKDLDLKYVLANRAWHEWFNPQGKDLIGKTAFDVFPPETAAALEAENRVTIERKAILKVEKKAFPRADGSTIPALVLMFPITNRRGEVIGVGGANTDLSEIKEQERTIERNEERFRRFYELDLTGMSVASPDKGLISFNDKLCQILGYSRDELLRKSWLEITHPDDRALHLAEHERVMAGETDGYTLTKRFIRKNGEIVHASLSTRVVRKADGAPDYFVSLIDDITQRKRTEDELARYRDQLEELVREKTAELIAAKDAADAANRAKSEFLSSMSHELRTPLNAILGFGQLLQFAPQEPLSSKQQDYVESILSAGGHLLELVNDVLDLAKLEAGSFEMNIEAIAPAEVIEDLLPMVGSLMKERELEFANLCDGPENIKVLVDRTRLKQSLLNLFSNAIKYNRERGIVSLDCQVVAGGRLRISIADDGIGIAKDKQPMIFDPFNRLGIDGSKIKGTGIGLTITKQLIEQMDGSVGFESVEGEGSTFWIDLPVSNLADRDESAVGAAGKGGPAR